MKTIIITVSTQLPTNCNNHESENATLTSSITMRLGTQLPTLPKLVLPVKTVTVINTYLI